MIFQALTLSKVVGLGQNTLYLFVYRKRFTDQENQQVIKRLVAEVKTLDSKIPSIQVKGK